MAGAGYRNWTPGDIPTATQFDTFLQEQTVMVFASAAARDTALSVAKAEGMLTFQLDSNSLTVYSGATWSTVGPAHGALTSWTPTVVQSGSVTVTNTASRYRRTGRWIEGYFYLTVTGSGSAGSPVIISGIPATASGPASLVIGTGGFSDAGTGNFYNPFGVALASTTSFDLRYSTGVTDPRLGVTGTVFPNGLAASDILQGTFAYEAAADA